MLGGVLKTVFPYLEGTAHALNSRLLCIQATLYQLIDLALEACSVVVVWAVVLTSTIESGQCQANGNALPYNEVSSN